MRDLHLEPINPIVYRESKNSNLGEGFPLICFQRLSRPNLATQQCTWWYNWYTRGLSAPVLSSSFSFISKGLDYIFTLPPNFRFIPLFWLNEGRGRRIVRCYIEPSLSGQSLRGQTKYF
ncbi:MAG: hypothetical protein COX39_00515 [Candidatus Nealsonbacteria bacterium CG23_combo_of_CG06-09_8_20_14_all_40_13]|uniref:Uncharacterized protein n=1 Tax=Candidatus Nealsonbacteria bacterium CG23_combo_of_CG06-09_8_20_14_all_40_13 TaxID=1974724 RepID=A0A2G9YT15_9BACT|nr:MAG: hypothetical protein COX39_00515 [Candidatus Nealsonbacteria bacterium CG23_combo_of_CG06-09_8_20_14_all_40_13]PIR70731.1 MAG: hypothetical protein COU44_03335 [Candidatus Nealsonbacteria bacterium CG10_big_fil_rev_8_21_14_0_10_40_24]PIU43218.1 MAG: hypothetical protein COS97_02140 [Candidatus Nealsonbacteria bacterium CG07_land_8_20_14_0_80_40_10]